MAEHIRASNSKFSIAHSGNSIFEVFYSICRKPSNFSFVLSNTVVETVKATFYLTISMRGQRAKGKIQRNIYHHGSCGPSLTGKTMSVCLIFTQGTHWNVKNR